MEGVFVNLTGKDLSYNGKFIPKVTGLTSSYNENRGPFPPQEIQGQTETELMNVPISLFKPLTRDHLSSRQIRKINTICNGHTRLLIMEMDEAIAWTLPNSEFIVPFSRYRILVPKYGSASDTITSSNGTYTEGFDPIEIRKFIEIPIPNTIIKSAVKFIKNKKTELQSQFEDLTGMAGSFGTPPTEGLRRSSDA